MTTSHPRPISISPNDERGSGGQTKLARLLDWHHGTVWRKLNGRGRITQSDELAIRQSLQRPPYNRPVKPNATQK